MSSERLAARNYDEIGPLAKRVSLNNPSKYVFVTVDFDYVLAHIVSRLPVYSPSASAFGHYWLNGKQRDFTLNQRIADQNATPLLT